MKVGSNSMVIVKLRHNVFVSCQNGQCMWHNFVDVKPWSTGPDYPHTVDDAVEAALIFAAEHVNRRIGHADVKLKIELSLIVEWEHLPEGTGLSFAGVTEWVAIDQPPAIARRWTLETS